MDRTEDWTKIAGGAECRGCPLWCRIWKSGMIMRSVNKQATNGRSFLCQHIAFGHSSQHQRRNHKLDGNANQ
eukprot:scaffold1308_cov189-Alexandrium_tamarense.AAC.3